MTKKNGVIIMVVCAHGDVSRFCEEHEMEILEKYEGDLLDYNGKCLVIVTDQKMSREEYESLKCKVFGHGYELVSVDWTDDAIILALLRQMITNRKKRGGRNPFGFRKEAGEFVEIPMLIDVARDIIRMRDAGQTLKYIRDHEGICHLDGKKLSMSTIQQIIKNREKYEK
jgi:hypothetical protein